ncbi:molybdenum cofactor guanylyltransferase [Comamonas serinivorans]|uniref:Molybdenum cofactor guanylyltransferase n=2 Tax=Comamonas serinivorans TaxID=1082851 RepID=A0A1Y0ESN5_9BURK|nr:molybdenum cofactor guanylyltransferase [Comamonas serinivorans]
MDYLKTQAPFWKQEGFVDGRATWVQPRDSDQQAQQRWAADAPSPLRLDHLRIGAVILAGGRGRRMGVVNKGLQPLAGQPLIQHVLAAIQPQVDAVVISANRDLPAYRALGHPVVPDEAPWHGLGPLAGIASALPHVPAHLDAILTVPCDTPFLPADLVHRLAQVLFAAEGHAAVVATTSDGQHAGIALFRPLAAWSLPRALQSPATRSLRHWLASLGSSAVLFDDADVLANCNDLAALQAADQALRAP